MASTRTAIAPVSVRALSQKKTASVRTAVAQETGTSAKHPLDGLKQLNDDVIAYLNQAHGAVYDENVAKLEQATGAKREHFAYGIGGLLALYLILGNSAALACNLIGFVYPAYVSLMAVSSGQKDNNQWLIYWTVFGLFTLIDLLFIGIESYYNVYWLVKAVFLVYLYLPQTNGAATIYAAAIEPLVKKIEGLLEKKQA